MTRRYTMDEILDLLKKAEKYGDLERQGRLVELPCPLETMVYQVVPDCDRCPNKETCKSKLRDNCIKKVMPCLFTINLLPEFGKTVFTTETEATVYAVSGRK